MARLECEAADGTTLGRAEEPVVVRSPGRPQGRLVRKGSVRVGRGSIPEMPASVATTRHVVRGAARQSSEDEDLNSPAHPFVQCEGATWVASTRTTGDGIATYIQFVPTDPARGIWHDQRVWRNENVPAYSQMWEELNRCANFSPELTGAERHSLYIQMACHAKYGATFFGGGNTWDLEAWRKEVEWSVGLSRDGRCGQGYGDTPDAGRYLLGRIVNAFPDANPSQRAAWLVELDGAAPVRRHITTTRAYGCLVAAGRPEARWYPAHFLDTYLPLGSSLDDAVCPPPPATVAPSASSPSQSAPTPVGPRPSPTPPAPAPRTWAEQQGTLGANTFSNPRNASGPGPRIAPYQWVDVACKVYAPEIASANPNGYWYRIASPPWNGAYYAVANTFWNGDIPGQLPYVHHTDFAVPDC